MLFLLLLQSVPDEPAFHEVVLAVETVSGSAEKDYILEVNGGGLLLGDFDSDGDADLVVVDGSTLERARADEPGFPPRLFLNDGAGGFARAGEEWDMPGGRWGMGGAVGDVNGDGHPDLFLTEWGPDRLFLNQGGEGFEEVTEEAGFRGGRWGTSAAFLDYERDGFLDLVVVNYLSFRLDELPASRTGGDCTWHGVAVMCGPEGLIPVHDQLYRGGGDGTFADVSVPAGFRPRAAAFGLGVVTLDHDVDGDTDIYVTNDSTPNHLWENQGDGTFAEVGMRRGVDRDPNGKEQAGMGIATGDLNADGRPDIFVTNFSAENNALYVSARRGYRDGSDRARLGGHSLRYLGWGTSMTDFDLDGDLDLAVFNGHVYPQADTPGTDTTYAQPDFLYRNDGTSVFVPEPLCAAAPTVSRACATGDLNGDGFPDLVALDLGGPVRVLLNRGGDGHFLRVQLRGAGPNRFGLGARVTARWGDRSRTVEITSAGGFQAAVLPEAHFGLGAAGKVDELVVRWPSGVEQVLTDVAVDRVLVVEPEIDDEDDDG